MRVGLFGGTFDPPHIGHLLMAVDAHESLGLDRVVFIPAATQPLKTGRVVTPGAERLALVRELVGGDPRFEVDPVEIERGGLSFTVDTLRERAARMPDEERFLLLGADTLAAFARWREPAAILGLARLALFPRVAQEAGSGFGAPSWTEEARADALAALRRAGASESMEPVFLPARRVDVSSTECRARVRAGRSLRGFVPEAVATRIAAGGLYR